MPAPANAVSVPEPPKRPNLSPNLVPMTATVALSEIQVDSKRQPALTTVMTDGELSPTMFAAWSSNMAALSIINLEIGAVLALIMTDIDEGRFPKSYLYVGLYALVLGVVLIYLEYGNQGAVYSNPVRRAVIFALSSILLFWTYPTSIAGGFFLVTSLTALVAWMNKEPAYKSRRFKALNQLYDKVRGDRQKTKTEDDEIQSKGILNGMVRQVKIIKAQNKTGVLVFMFLYLVANLFIFINALVVWFDKNSKLAPEDQLSGYGPLAKGFGNLLDFNCSAILVPVLRTIIRWLYNTSTSDQGCFALALRYILNFVPIDHALSFHKIVAMIVAWCAIGHTIFHFLNYAHRPDQTLALFGVWPWVSGGIVLLCMFFMYSSAKNNTKRGQFETFWYSHQLFVVFFVMLLLHGNGGFNPNFWRWFIGPGILYVLERLVRVYRAKQPIRVMSVFFAMPDVICLEVAKEGPLSSYSEGQYCFLKFPGIAQYEWHPFTISSAPSEPTVTFHIKVMGPGSWTYRVRKYFMSMTSFQRDGIPYKQFEHLGPQGRQPGKLLGPDNQALLQVDGPHSAPTQHIGEYKCSMVIGAGIGVTPVASAMKSVVFHNWKFSHGDTYPANAYFIWSCSWKDVDSFRWLAHTMKACQDEVNHMRRVNKNQGMNQRVFEVHVYVTSVPKDARQRFVAPTLKSEEEKQSYWGYHKKHKGEMDDMKLVEREGVFTLEELWYTIKNPTEHTQLGDIHIYAGRPKWKPHFQTVNDRHKDGHVGVMFCGNPRIKDALELHCYQATKKRANTKFKLHAENF